MAAGSVVMRPPGERGLEFEELLRAYFLRSGHFVLRGVPFRVAGEDLTDIDLWLYERPTGTSRRVLIADAKFKSRPKAAERLLWTRGLAEALGADDAYVATTDSRPSLKLMAARVGVTLFDGNDVKRLSQSNKIAFPERITEEDLLGLVAMIDQKRGTKDFASLHRNTKSIVAGGLGAGGAIRSLESARFFAEQAIVAHPSSDLAKTSGRLFYFSSAISAINLDFLSVEAPFRSNSERRELIANAIRYGNTAGVESLEKLKLATALISRFADGGEGISRIVERRYLEELSRIPSDIIADQVIRMTTDDTLMLVAREIEAAAYNVHLPGFDALSSSAKSYLGAVLDFCGVDRAKFATSWEYQQNFAFTS